MSYTTKRKILNTTVYIVLGLVITAVICVTIATFAGMRKKQPTADTPAPAPATEQKNAPNGTDNAGPAVQPSGLPDNGKTPTSEPDSNDASGKKDDQPAIEPVKPVYCLPATGAVQKTYSPSQPVRSLTMNDYRTHDGIDIGAPIGSAVCALTDGTILDIYSDPMMGMCMSIDHGNGLVSTYKNLSFTLPDGIAKGVTVKAGDVVAAVGDTSLIELAEAEHLHFEMTLNGKHVDPGSYLDLSGLTEDAGTE